MTTVHATLGHNLRDALAAIGAALDFGDHYGTNLDALNDCLSDLTEDTTLVIDDGEHFASRHREDWARLRSVLDLRSRPDYAERQGFAPGAPLPGFSYQLA